jgi:hypothetical protein
MPRRARWCIFGVLSFAVFGCSSASTTTPSATATSNLLVGFVQHTARLEQGAHLDLDTGAVAPGTASGADVWFEAVNATERYLTPENGTSLAVMGTTEPSYAACQSARGNRSRIPITSLAAGTHLCGQTNSGAVVEIRVDEAAAPDAPGTSLAPALVLRVTLYFS